MMERFAGERGQHLLLEALGRQVLLAGDRELAEHILARVHLVEFDAGQTILSQGDTDNDVCFILVGRVAVEINGQEMAIRAAGNHIGEMAALDPAASRSATVRAVDRVVIARLSEADFSEVGEQYPQLWKRLAIELGDRLRQRGRFVRIPNDRPQVFIGSSSEMLPIAQAIQYGLRYDNFFVQVWTDGVFRPSEANLDELLRATERVDFGILVVGPDDLVTSRGQTADIPRDNVIFELGLFMGAIGRSRVVLVKPRGIDIRLPTDLLGTIPIEYDASDASILEVRIAPVCTEIRGLVARLGVK